MVVENKFGRTIRSLRLKHKMTQVKIATKLGVHPTTIGQWELGRTVPKEKYLMQLKGIFRLSDNEFEALTIGIRRKRVVTPENRENAHKQRLEASRLVGNDKLSEMEEDDPRLIFFRKAYGAL